MVPFVVQANNMKKETLLLGLFAVSASIVVANKIWTKKVKITNPDVLRRERIKELRSKLNNGS